MTNITDPSLHSRSIPGGQAKDFDPNIQIPITFGGGNIEADKQVVGKALTAFERVAQKAAQRASQELVYEAKSNPAMREALTTREVQHPTMPNVMGVQKSNYAVFPMPQNINGKAVTRYDVVNMGSEQKLVEGLGISASAEAIVKLLNKGYSFYSPEIKTVLEMEQKYNNYYNEAVTYQRKSGDPTKDAIRVERFDQAKHKFLTIKEELIKFNNKLS